MCGSATTYSGALAYNIPQPGAVATFFASIKYGTDSQQWPILCNRAYFVLQELSIGGDVVVNAAVNLRDIPSRRTKTRISAIALCKANGKGLFSLLPSPRMPMSLSYLPSSIIFNCEVGRPDILLILIANNR